MIDLDPLKGLPADILAEKAILGAIQLNNNLCAHAAELLRCDDFFLNSHRRIFDAMIALHKSGNPIDTVTLPRLLADRGELEQIGGVTYLASLIDGIPRTDTIEYYAKIVKYKARERRAIANLNNAVTRLVDGEDDLDTILETVKSDLAQISEESNDASGVQGFYSSLDELFSADFEDAEQILFGVHRGEVAGLLAVTNYGKTTLMYNTALSLAAGQACRPLASDALSPRRVLYIDSESPAARARADLQQMIRGVGDARTARANFITMVDAAIAGAPLSLSRPDHFKKVLALAKSLRVDLVVIDTAASAFELQDENSNAEVTRRLMNPLKALAREVNCAVVFTHHIGKANETQTGEGAYRGRGASAFGALSRTIFTIERDAKKGQEYVTVSCPKVKGQPFEPVLLKLNAESRWFEICEDKPSAKPEPVTAREIADFVGAQGEAKTEDIKRHFAGRASTRTIADRIGDAERMGLIIKANQKAPWRLCNGKNGDSEACAQGPAESTVGAFVQCATPIRDCTNAQTGSNGHGSRQSVDFGYCSDCDVEGIRFTHCAQCGGLVR